MSKRYLITVTNEVGEMLEAIMKEHVHTFPSPVVRDLIVEEMKRRKEAKKRPAPVTTTTEKKAEKEYPDNEPRDIPHPDSLMNKGVFMTQSEFDAYMELKSKKSKLNSDLQGVAQETSKSLVLVCILEVLCDIRELVIKK